MHAYNVQTKTALNTEIIINNHEKGQQKLIFFHQMQKGIYMILHHALSPVD